MIKDIFDGYSADYDGFIISHKRGNKRLIGQINRYGYPTVTVMVNGLQKNMVVHRLIAKAFIPNPNNLEQVNHKDGNKLNNSVNNLEWVSKSDNVKHAFRIGLQKTYSHNSRSTNLTWNQVNVIREAFEKGYSQKSIAAYFNMTGSNINHIVHNKTWNKGYEATN
jgi:hypothetical protein